MRQLNIPGVRNLVLGQGGDYMIDKTYIKFWPAEYHSQSAIDACLQLRPAVLGNEITQIHIRSFEAAVSIIGSEPEKLRPTSRETADHSMFYCCAAALVDGDVTLDTFNEDRLSDPRLLNLIDKTVIVEDEEMNCGYPRGIPNHVTITCANGTKVNNRVDFPRGHSGNPMTDDEVAAKFNRMANGVIGEKTAAQILDRAWNLDSLKDITPLFAFSVGDSKPSRPRVLKTATVKTKSVPSRPAKATVKRSAPTKTRSQKPAPIKSRAAKARASATTKKVKKKIRRR